MPFGYVRPNGNWEEYDADIDEILRVRCFNPTRLPWLRIAQVLSIPHARMEEMRSSPQWREAVESWLRDRGELTNDRNLRRCGVKFPRSTRSSEPVVQNIADIKFGVEIECVSVVLNLREINQAINEAGLTCAHEDYNHELRNRWKVVYDGSIVSESSLTEIRHGAEVVSPPIKGEDGFNQIRTVCNVLNRIGCIVNKTCGLHVHVDASNLSIRELRNICTSWLKYEHVIESLVPPSRRRHENRFCRSNVLRYNYDEVSAMFERINNARNRTSIYNAMCPRVRNYKLNVRSLGRHGTLEFRYHGGTLNARKIQNHVKFCIGFVNHFKNVPYDEADISLLDLPRDLNLMPQLMESISAQLPEAERVPFVRYYYSRRLELGGDNYA